MGVGGQERVIVGLSTDPPSHTARFSSESRLGQPTLGSLGKTRLLGRGQGGEDYLPAGRLADCFCRQMHICTINILTTNYFTLSAKSEDPSISV